LPSHATFQFPRPHHISPVSSSARRPLRRNHLSGASTFQTILSAVQTLLLSLFYFVVLCRLLFLQKARQITVFLSNCCRACCSLVLVPTRSIIQPTRILEDTHPLLTFGTVTLTFSRAYVLHPFRALLFFDLPVASLGISQLLRRVGSAGVC
jgi:hypothetical protein